MSYDTVPHQGAHDCIFNRLTVAQEGHSKAAHLVILSFENSSISPVLIRGGAQYSKLGDLNDPGSLRVGGSEGRDVLDHYHNVIH